jgi:hypothetical protein
MEQRTCENPLEKGKQFHAMLKECGTGVNMVNFKTPSPNTCDSAFMPLTQPPPPIPPATQVPFSAGISSGGRSVVPQAQMHQIFNPYGTLLDYVSGRKSAPPMLPSPPSNQMKRAPSVMHGGQASTKKASCKGLIVTGTVQFCKG